MVMVLDKLGRLDEARSLLRPYLDHGVATNRLGIAYAGICLQTGNCDEGIETLRGLLSKPGRGSNPRQEMSDQQEMNHYLGKLYDKSGDYDRAFFHFTTANELKKRDSPFDPDAHVRMVDEILSGYTSERIGLAATSGCNSERPLFILGMPRSGTTLVEQILCSHPVVFGGGEQQQLPIIAETLDQRPGNSQVRPPSIDDLSSDKLSRAAASYLNEVAKLSGDALYVTDKMLYNFFHLGLIQLMFPRCKVVHCVRDPLDTCLSTYFQNFSGYQSFATDLRFIGIYYNSYRRLMEHWQQELDLPIHTVNYETLTGSQESETRRLLEFCELEWDPNCLNFHENPRIALTASNNQIRRPMYRTSVKRWKHYEKHIQELKSILSEG
jgi:hypothetical protein